MTDISTDNTKLDAIAERIFHEAEGDLKWAYDSAREHAEYHDLSFQVTQKFKAVSEAAAERIYIATGDERDRAFQLAKDQSFSGAHEDSARLRKRHYAVAMHFTAPAPDRFIPWRSEKPGSAGGAARGQGRVALR